MPFLSYMRFEILHELILWSSLHEALSSDDLETFPFFVRVLWSVIPFLFRARFGISNELNALPLFRTRFEVLDDPMTSLLFRMRFEANLDLLILLSSSARGSKLIWIYWYFYPPQCEVRSWSFNRWFVRFIGLTLDCQTWFYFGLVLESQSNLILFSPFTYLDLPLAASLVALLTLPRTSIWLDLQL